MVETKFTYVQVYTVAKPWPEGGKIGEQEPWLDALPPYALLTHFYHAATHLPSATINAIQGKPTTCCSCFDVNNIFFPKRFIPL